MNNFFPKQDTPYATPRIPLHLFNPRHPSPVITRPSHPTSISLLLIFSNQLLTFLSFSSLTRSLPTLVLPSSPKSQLLYPLRNNPPSSCILFSPSLIHCHLNPSPHLCPISFCVPEQTPTLPPPPPLLRLSLCLLIFRPFLTVYFLSIHISTSNFTSLSRLPLLLSSPCHPIPPYTSLCSFYFLLFCTSFSSSVSLSPPLLFYSPPSLALILFRQTNQTFLPYLER